MNKICILKNPIQEYAWGSRTAIAELLGEPTPSQKPQAELWMGAHPKAPSQVLSEGGKLTLDKWIEHDPQAILGKSAAARFSNQLPFLFKVLAAAKPLSIQAHPNSEQAKEGFSRENKQGIPLNAFHRNYRDASHKPELICALTSFWGLNGFRKAEEIIRLMDSICPPILAKHLQDFSKQPTNEGLRQFFRALMMMGKKQQRQIVNETITLVKANSHTDIAYDWMIRLHEAYPGDIGVLSPALLNLVQLQPGEAMFLAAGDLHAYFEGVGIELMANSDNVLRGGLTSKHIDVPELLKNIRFESKEISVLSPEMLKTGEQIYSTSSEEFVLSAITVHENSVFTSAQNRSVEIILCVKGNTDITDLHSGDIIPLPQGTTVIIPASVDQYRIEGTATLYKAGVPNVKQ